MNKKYRESNFKEFRRMVYCATLEMEGRDRLILYDTVLHYVGNGDLTFSGLELDVVATEVH